MAKIRVMHYINHFFAGIGGEAKANVALDFREGSLGPGQLLQTLLGESAEVVLTAYCGDDYFPGHHDNVIEQIIQKARDYKIDMLVAGPAFMAGRYGFACTEISHRVSTALGLYCITGMHTENPGLVGYQQYKDKKVFLFPTADSVSGMEEALLQMVRFMTKLISGSVAGSAAEEGYISRGFRLVKATSRSGAERAVAMLLAKTAGLPFTTEIPIGSEEVIAVAPSVGSLKDACLAMVTTSGVVPWGNPDGIKSSRNKKWYKYAIDKIDDMKCSKWDVIHCGYDTTYMRLNPNFGVPLDACTELQEKGVFARLYPYFYVTAGVNSFTDDMQRIGEEMAGDMKKEGINGALLVST